MADILTEKQVTLPYQERGRGWSLKIRTSEQEVHLDLHWGDKTSPTHELTLTRNEFIEVLKDLDIPVITPHPKMEEWEEWVTMEANCRG